MHGGSTAEVAASRAEWAAAPTAAIASNGTGAVTVARAAGAVMP